MLFYTARDGDNHMKLQLHRVGLDGKGDNRLTDPAFHHTVGGACGTAGRAQRGISPDNAISSTSPDARHAAGDAGSSTPQRAR